MKLLELNTHGSKKTAKVMEQHFGSKVAVNTLPPVKAAALLSRVRTVLKEYKSTKGTVNTENSPAYLKALMMEQALTQHVKENIDQLDPDTIETIKVISSAEQGKPVQANDLKKLGSIAKMAVDGGVKESAGILDEAAVEELCELARPHLNKCRTKKDVARCIDECAMTDGGKMHMKVYPMAERQAALESLCSMSESRVLREASEVEKSQVVLAAQDMVQSIQDMIEDVSEMQYKELPALVQAIKYDLDAQKATQFQQTVQGVLQTLLQTLTEQKGQMDLALGNITGEEAGAELGAMADDELAGDIGGEELPDLGDEEIPDEELPDLGGEEGEELPDLEPEEPAIGTSAALGRSRR